MSDLTLSNHHQNLLKRLITFSIPLILSGILQQLYSWTDAFILGHVVGEGALAATGCVSVITSFYILVLTGFTSGLNILSARYFGEGRTDAQKEILLHFNLILGGFFTLLSVLTLLFTEPILHLLDTPSDIFTDADLYLKISLAGIPFLTVYDVYAAVLRGIGDSKTPFYGILFSSVSNILLDLLFVIKFQQGVSGAAAATVLSQVLLCVFMILYTIRRYPSLRYSLRAFHPNPTLFREGCTLSLPITVQSAVTSVGNLVLQAFMNGFGTATVAAITTAYRVDCIILLPLVNLGTAVSTLVSQAVGAKKPKQATATLLTGSVLTAGISLLLTGFVFAFGGDLIALFGVSAPSVAIGYDFFRAIAIFYPIFGLATAMRGYIEGIGAVLWSACFGIASLLLRIALSYALVPFFGNMVIAYAEGFSWCFLCFVYAAICARFVHKNRTTAKKEL